MTFASPLPVADHFRGMMLSLAAALSIGGALSLVNYGLNAPPDGLTHACLWGIMAFMALIASNANSAHRFLFSCAFWVTVEFLFYIVLKALAVIDDLDAKPMNMALLSSLLFLVGYFIGQLAWPMPQLLRPPAHATPPAAASRRLYWWLLLSFIGFKLLNAVLMMLAGGGDTALEVSQSTQNQGASYLFKIPTLALASYFLMLLFAYKHRMYKKTALAMTLYVLAEGVAGAARYSIITTLLINLLLLHLYVRPVRLIFLLLLAPLLVFVVAFFGYVRDIQLASLDVYANALGVFVDERELMFKLFMGRLDMLPQMVEAFRLDELHQLKNVSGMSYVYSLLHAIPRSIWPSKPPLTAAYVTEAVNPGVFDDGVNIYPSVMVEGYMNFMWAGVVLAGFALAGLSTLYERALLRGSLRAQAFVLLAFTFPMAFINEGFHSNIFATILYLMAIYWLWLRLTRWAIGPGHVARLAQP